MAKFALQDQSQLKSGVVTLLDVLGWKGVYNRKADALADFSSLLDTLGQSAQQRRGTINAEIIVKSISDTIAIFTSCSDKEVSKTIEVHGALCVDAIPDSIARGIPLRGATSYGEFSLSKNNFVGKAIDEAAGWYEEGDWIGVNLTPTASLVFQPLSNSVWVPYRFPNKSRLPWTTRCVNWTSGWSDAQAELQKIEERFAASGPFLPSTASKYINTVEFIKAMRSPLVSRL